MSVLKKLKTMVEKAEKKAPSGNASVSAPALVELVVWSVPHNRQLVICHKPGVDPLNPLNLAALQVRDNAHFLKNMRVMRARPVSANRFDLEGPLPRWKGKW